MNKKSVMYPHVSFVMIALALVSLLVLLFMSVGLSEGSGQTNPTIPVHLTDGAPEAGSLTLFVQYGMLNRPEGYAVGSWRVAKGQRLDVAAKAPATNYARLWFRSDATGQWYLLPSQYWDRNEVRNLGHVTCRSEYGVSASSPLPSYHTGFWQAIPQHRVPLFIDEDGCGRGSAATRYDPMPAPATTRAPQSTLSTQSQSQYQSQPQQQQQQQIWKTKDW